VLIFVGPVLSEEGTHAFQPPVTVLGFKSAAMVVSKERGWGSNRHLGSSVEKVPDLQQQSDDRWRRYEKYYAATVGPSEAVNHELGSPDV